MGGMLFTMEAETAKRQFLEYIEILNERNKIAIASRENDRVEFRGELHRINRESDIPVGLFRAISENL